MTTKKTFGPKGWTPERLGSLAGKTYVITGANNGAGFEATRVFLSKGAKVVMMNRNADKSNYIGVAMLYGVILSASGLLRATLGSIPILGWFLVYFPGMYALMATGRMLGLFYRDNSITF